MLLSFPLDNVRRFRVRKDLVFQWSPRSCPWPVADSLTPTVSEQGILRESFYAARCNDIATNVPIQSADRSCVALDITPRRPKMDAVNRYN